MTETLDTGELELPETVFVRDIENRVFQAYVLQVLSKIEGIALLSGNFIDNILGRDSLEGIRGIHAEQDSQSHTVKVKVEVNICYGLSIPEKADEIQSRITEEITHLTGLHVASVHVVVKNVLLADPREKLIGCQQTGSEPEKPVLTSGHLDNEYTDEF
jgi:uncharacterized alkaline shock family protein YloU